MTGVPRDLVGLFHTATALVATAGGIALSVLPSLAGWAAGQVILALALLKWFVLLHEAGHDTLCRSRWLNRLIGGVAGFGSGIPFGSWRRVHALHHHHTGWQDLDPTTAALVPRPVGCIERLGINIAWRLHLPVFSLAYRWQNFWNPVRMHALLRTPAGRSAFRRSAASLLAAYLGLAALTGPALLLQCLAAALVSSLVVQDFVILGQHTHRPSGFSAGRRVPVVAAADQGPYTRSVLLPRWLSWWLLHFDRHALHHLQPGMPGYDLGRLKPPDAATASAVHWWRWWRASRRLSGVDFLFGRSDRTGLWL